MSAAMRARGWVELADLDLEDRAEVGSKAAVLGALLRRGLPVPEGFAVPDAGRWRGSCPLESAAGLIARSSAPGEDGWAASFAGQLESIGGLQGRAALIAAVRRVSRPPARARTYAARLRLQLPERIPVLVQRQVRSRLAGVLFTVDPLGQRPRAFTIGWGERSAVTDGNGGGFRTFDPLAPQAEPWDEPAVARAIPELVEHAFAAQGILSREAPLDLEWLLDEDGRLWIVQARPVTAFKHSGNEALERALAQGFQLVSPRPASRLAQHQFAVAAEVDRSAARFHHAHFERRVDGGWLLARRVKVRSRPKIDAGSPLAFAASILWKRRRNLAFGFAYLAAWKVVERATERWAARALSGESKAVDDRGLARMLSEALRSYDRVRRVHAGLWYPVDLARDLEEFEKRFGPAGLRASLPTPRRRTSRDRETARLVMGIRLRHGGAHPLWEELSQTEREEVCRHLRRHPHAFDSAAEVQDLAAWTSWLERPEAWWSQQSALAEEELGRLADASPAPLRPKTGLAGGVVRGIAALYAPLKDDRVELLALAACALRRVLVEAERRAGTDDAVGGWIFELEPDELRDLHRRPGLRKEAEARLRRRLVEGFCGPELATPSTGEAQAHAGEIECVALAAGTAAGRACVVRSADEAQRRLRTGEVLVAEEIRPAFTAVLPRACALVCRRGTPLSHAAIVARELSIPAVSLEEWGRIRDGAALAVDGTRGRLRLTPERRGGS